MWNRHCKSYNLILSHRKQNCIKLLHLIILFIFMHNRRWIKLTFLTWVPPSLLLLSSWTFSLSCNKKSIFSFCLASKRSFSCCKNIETCGLMEFTYWPHKISLQWMNQQLHLHYMGNSSMLTISKVVIKHFLHRY